MRQTLILDSTQITSWYECNESWILRFQENLVPINKLDPSKTWRPNENIAAGTLGHKFLETYYLFGGGKAGMSAALSVNVDEMDQSELDKHQFPLNSDLRQRVRNRFVDYMSFYGNDYEMIWKETPSIEVKNGFLVDTVKREALVEKGFSYELLNTREYLFVLEGRIDLIARARTEILWVDHKFQIRAHDLHPKCIQFRNYALATGLPIGTVNYIRLHDKLDKTTLVRQPISFNPMELNHWKSELIQAFVDISRTMPRHSLNRASCSNLGGWGKPCIFNEMCNEYFASTREAIKNQNFTKGKVWKPW